MSFGSREDLLKHWVPEQATVLYDFESTVVYIYDWNLVVLRVFTVGNVWHISVDVNKTLDELQELLM